jgi:hypothetical protein
MYWRDFFLARERQERRMREAEKQRLVRQALAGRPRRRRFHCQALAWLGNRLVAWGWLLLTRYGAAVEVPVLRACEPRPASTGNCVIVQAAGRGVRLT